MGLQQRSRPAVIVMAKEPRPGRVKTRLCPPLSFEEAAEVAAASLADTIAAVASLRWASAVVALDGSPGPWLPEGVQVIAQRGEGFDERLANAFEDIGGPALAIAGDTPQVTPSLLAECLAALGRRRADAVLGHAPDGGYWVIGLRRADPRAFLRVPMSQPTTGRDQVDRLMSLGLTVADMPELRDVDTFEDAVTVAAEIPGSRFAAALAHTAAYADAR